LPARNASISFCSFDLIGLEKLNPQRSSDRSVRAKLTARESIAIRSPSSSRVKCEGKAASTAAVAAGKPAIALRTLDWM